MKLTPDRCWDCRFLARDNGGITVEIPYEEFPYCVLWKKKIENQFYPECQSGVIRDEE